jgi:hypothetical protein
MIAPNFLFKRRLATEIQFITNKLTALSGIFPGVDYF